MRSNMNVYCIRTYIFKYTCTNIYYIYTLYIVYMYYIHYIYIYIHIIYIYIHTHDIYIYISMFPCIFISIYIYTHPYVMCFLHIKKRETTWESGEHGKCCSTTRWDAWRQLSWFEHGKNDFYLLTFSWWEEYPTDNSHQMWSTHAICAAILALYITLSFGYGHIKSLMIVQRSESALQSSGMKHEIASQPTNQLLAPPNNSINQQSSSIKDLTAQAYRNHIAINRQEQYSVRNSCCAIVGDGCGSFFWLAVLSPQNSWWPSQIRLNHPSVKFPLRKHPSCYIPIATWRSSQMSFHLEPTHRSPVHPFSLNSQRRANLSWELPGSVRRWATSSWSAGTASCRARGAGGSSLRMMGSRTMRMDGLKWVPPFKNPPT